MATTITLPVQLDDDLVPIYNGGARLEALNGQVIRLLRDIRDGSNQTVIGVSSLGEYQQNIEAILAQQKAETEAAIAEANRKATEAIAAVAAQINQGSQ